MIFSVATKKGGNCVTTGPTDVCKVPAPPAPFVPTPFPNIAMLNQATGCSSKVKINNMPVFLKSSKIPMSTGDEPGTLGGMVSGRFKGPAKPQQASMKLKVEGKAVVYQTCMMGMNGDTPNTVGVCLPSEMSVKVSG
jgi:hypothetical protein